MENNNKSNLPLIFIFVIIFIFIFFMPNIMKLFDKDPTPISGSQDNNKAKEVNPVEISTLYDYVDGLEIKYDEVKIDKFDLTNGFTFTLTNNKTVSLTSNDHYFLELYDNDETLLERLYLAIDQNMAPATHRQYAFSSKQFNKIKLVKKNVSDYPYVSKELNDNNEYVLTCIGKDTYTYTFDSNMKLNHIKYSYIENKTDGLNYMEDAILYKNKAIELDTINGVDATYQESLNHFDFLALYNLSSITDKKIYNNKVYPLDTELKVVSFEMNSQEYTCE